jgi:hypothetical protein
MAAFRPALDATGFIQSTTDLVENETLLTKGSASVTNEAAP